MAITFAVDFVGAVIVPTPQPPVPVLVRPTNLQAKPDGGASFDLVAAVGATLPTQIRALWLPLAFDKTTPAEVIYSSGYPSIDLGITVAGTFTVSPPATVAPGTYQLAIVSLFNV